MSLTDTPEAGAPVAPIALLDGVLSRVRLAGALFLLGEYSAPWAYHSPASSDLSQFLDLPPRRLFMFHLIAEGECVIRLIGGPPLALRSGDVVVLPGGHPHFMGSAPDAEATDLGSLMSPPPWAEFPHIELGGGGAATRVVCGYLHYDDGFLDAVIGALPPVFRIHPAQGSAASWLAASIQYASEACKRGFPVTSGIAVRLPELLFQEVLRFYFLETEPPELGGWLAGLKDPMVGRALMEIHHEPDRHWTVDDLAGQAGYSRSAFSDRFKRLVGRAPMGYVSDLRLHIARGLLRETDLPVAAVAGRVGYESEEAFNRAFKRASGRPPAQWRQQGALPGRGPEVEFLFRSG